MNLSKLLLPILFFIVNSALAVVFIATGKDIKDEMISIPNLSVMGKEIKNFSALKEALVYISVTLGYEVDKDIAQKIANRKR